MKATPEGIAVLMRQLENMTIEADPPRNPPTLPPERGDDKDGGMEARVAKLEADVSYLVKQVDRISPDVATTKTDVAVIKATMAGKGFIITVVTAGAGAIVGLLTALSKLGILAAG